MKIRILSLLALIVASLYAQNKILPIADTYPVIVVLDSLFDTDIETAFRNDRGLEGTGVFYRPISLALGQKGKFYVSDMGNFTVTAFDNLQGDNWFFMGNSVNSQNRKDTDFRMPSGIDVDDDGNILVADWGNNRIVHYGKNWQSFGTKRAGPALGQFQSPRDVAFGADGKIFVLDSGNNRIVSFFEDDSLEQWQSFGSHGSREAEFVSPQGIYVTEDGEILICDTGNRRIVKIDNIKGENWETFNNLGTENTHLNNPKSVTKGPDGRIYIADQDNNRIVRIDDMSGSNWAELQIPKKDRNPRIEEIVFSESGQLYILLMWDYLVNR